MWIDIAAAVGKNECWPPQGEKADPSDFVMRQKRRDGHGLLALDNHSRPR